MSRRSLREADLHDPLWAVSRSANGGSHHAMQTCGAVLFFFGGGTVRVATVLPPCRTCLDNKDVALEPMACQCSCCWKLWFYPLDERKKIHDCGHNGNETTTSELSGPTVGQTRQVCNICWLAGAGEGRRGRLPHPHQDRLTKLHSQQGHAMRTAVSFCCVGKGHCRAMDYQAHDVGRGGDREQPRTTASQREGAFSDGIFFGCLSSIVRMSRWVVGCDATSR